MMAASVIVKDETSEEKRIKHYSSRHKILLVGEGNFSFSVSLSTAFCSAINMVATSLDSQGTVISKHPSAIQNLEKLKARGCTILHATTMCHHPDLHDKLFDRIVFNFPHAGFIAREHDEYQIQLHQEVVRGFLSNARTMLTADGQVHVTHKTAHPFYLWEIVKLAEDEGLSLVKEASFSKGDYPGYCNKRGDGSRSDQTFPVGVSSTFIFSNAPDFHLNSN